jgi:hypothetical protein
LKRLRKIARLALAILVRSVQWLASPWSSSTPIVIIQAGADREDFMRRLRFFSTIRPESMQFTESPGWRMMFSMRPVLRYDASIPRQALFGLRTMLFEVDPLVNPNDGWEWCRFSRLETPNLPIEKNAAGRLRRRVEELRRNNLEKCYVFGTGTSLAEAIDRDWSDGYRIVCNTIARDRELWAHINPHFIVAGDAIYHFGFTEFAHAFRSDLAKRLRETNTYFVFPALFSSIVAREFAGLEDRLIPIPQGHREDVDASLTEVFSLPKLGNVLNLLLLPLACTLSQKVHLWGFDGRAPDDKLFWSNSSKHSYPELMWSLQQAHPAFFQYYVPVDKPNAYVQSVHGDKLDATLRASEKRGWEFVMMHKTWTATLQKRYHPTEATSR